MPRPVKPRWVQFFPQVTYFKPAGVPLSTLDEVSLGVDELEAIRLKDLIGLEQEECARQMRVAQSTFQRVLTSARQKIASALVEGKAIKIEGGHYRFSGSFQVCRDCGARWAVEPSQVNASACPKCGSKRLDAAETSNGAPAAMDDVSSQQGVQPPGRGCGRGPGPHRGPKWQQ